MARNLCNSQQISIIPFEVFCDGYWHWTDGLRVRNGVISFAPVGNRWKSEKPIGIHDIRLRSKKATSSDCCQSSLRPGMDICVHVRVNKKKEQDPSQEKDHHVFQDARITRISRQPHRCGCNCVFYVKYYIKEVNGNNRRSIPGEEEVTIRSIYILQKLHVDYCRDGKRSWKLSENCTFFHKSRLLDGPFSSEFAWVMVLSILKGMEFRIKLVRDVIVFLIMDSPDSHVDTKSNNTKEMADDGGVSYPRTRCAEIRILILERVDGKVVSRIESLDCKTDSDSDTLISHDHMFCLRRSTRLKTTATPGFFANLFDKQHPRRDPGRQRGHFQMMEDRGDDEMKRVGSCCRSSKNGGRKRKRKRGVVVENVEEDGRSCGSLKVYRRSRRRSARRLDDECDDLMGDCVNNIKAKMRRKSEVVVGNVDASYYAGPVDLDWEDADTCDGQEREHEDLWKEMEYALSILPYLEERKDMNTSLTSNKGLDFCTDSWENSCRHSIFLDEELGIMCRFCKSVITERRYVLPSFAINSRKSRGDGENNFRGEEDASLPNSDLPDAVWMGLRSSKQAISPPPHISKDVWSLIPELEPKLHPHQKKAFEFLWKNIAGSLNPQISNPNPPPNTGGCIISHSPGTGKTFLVVSFLVSYLRTFDGQHPLILAPKTALSVWIEEFRKWHIPIPIYTIHPLDTYRKTCRRSLHGQPKPPTSMRRRHMLDCLEKLGEWHDRPSVLLMSYTSFSLLAQEDRSDPRRSFVSDVLRKSPGLLILDEGHNPRSTGSKLRALLMSVTTNRRVLLSGTPFQNNFVEYFNTLCLARPSFAGAAMKELKLDGGKTEEEEAARTAFARKIGRSFESKKASVRKKAFRRLMEMTRSFVDVYSDDHGASSTLPGLKVYTVLLNSTSPQKEILDKLHDLRRANRNSWEIELLITVASIHPSLVRSISTPRKSRYFDEGELRELSKLRDDHRNGSKMGFLVEMVHRCTKREKLLVFCRNIAPITMMVETLGRIFGWKEGREILVLEGKQDLLERGKAIAEFGKASSSKVMLVSTTACSEGISLTAASRVVLMDSEWNYSKTQQAIGRAFRPGQEKVVHVYQLLAAETLEEDKYRLKEKKEWVSKMIATGRYAERFDRRQLLQVEDYDDNLRGIMDEEKMKVFVAADEV